MSLEKIKEIKEQTEIRRDICNIVSGHKTDEAIDDLKDKAVDKIIDYSSKKIDSSSKEDLLNKVRRLYSSQKSQEKAEQSLLLYNVLDKDTWSKQERSQLSALGSNQEALTSFLKTYSENITISSPIKNRNIILKQITQLSEFLKASPYNEKNFSKSIIKSATSLLLNNDFDKVELMKTAFNLGLSKRYLEDIISNNLEQQATGMNIIKAQAALNIRHKEEFGDSKFMAYAMGSLALLTQVDSITSEVSNKAIEGIVKGYVYLEMSPNVPSFLRDATINTMDKISNFSISHPSIYFVAGALSIGFLSKFPIKEKLEVVEKFTNAIKNFFSKGYIVNQSPDEINNESYKKNLLQQYRNNINVKEDFYKSTNLENKNYLLLQKFIHEKINNPTYKVEKKLIDDLKLTKEQIKELNTFNLDKLHTIVSVKTPYIRKTLFLNYNNIHNHVDTLVSLDLLIQSKRKNLKINGSYFPKIYDLEMYSHNSLLKKIAKRPEIERQLLNLYLHAHAIEGKVDENILKALEKVLDDGKNIDTFIKKELESEINTIQKEKHSVFNIDKVLRLREKNTQRIIEKEMKFI